MQKTECAVLTGFVRVLDAPSFVIPLFHGCNHRGHHDTSVLLAQCVASDHTISDFIAFALAEDTLIPSSLPLEVRVNAPCVVGYEISDDKRVVGPTEYVKECLGEYVESALFDNKPFSQWEVCEFCGRTDVFPKIAKKVQSNSAHVKTSAYFLTNCLAKPWIDSKLARAGVISEVAGKRSHESGRPVMDSKYKLFMQNGQVAFTVSDKTDHSFHKLIASHVTMFNNLMSTQSDRHADIERWIMGFNNIARKSKSNQTRYTHLWSETPDINETLQSDRYVNNVNQESWYRDFSNELRHWTVLKLLREGKPIKSIADELAMSQRMVNQHVHQCMRELGLRKSVWDMAMEDLVWETHAGILKELKKTSGHQKFSKPLEYTYVRLLLVARDGISRVCGPKLDMSMMNIMAKDLVDNVIMESAERGGGVYESSKSPFENLCQKIRKKMEYLDAHVAKWDRKRA